MTTISLLLIVKYNGNHFFGNAISEKKSVIGEIITQFKKYKIDHICHYWCGRTDRGVNAFNMPLSIELSYIHKFDYEKILNKANEFHVKKIFAILNDRFEIFNRNKNYTNLTISLNIRKYTISRTYFYFIKTNKLASNFLDRLQTLRESKNLINYCKPSEYRLNKDFYKTKKYFLLSAKYERVDEYFPVFKFTSAGFLYNQIRRMVGYLCNIDLISPTGLFFAEASIKYGNSTVNYDDIKIPNLNLRISDELFKEILYEIN